MSFLRRHRTLALFFLLGLLSLAAFTWAEWHYFLDQASSHHEPAPGFWSAEHAHDWTYNAMANWQSEFLVGAFAVYLLAKHAPQEDEEADDFKGG